MGVKINGLTPAQVSEMAESCEKLLGILGVRQIRVRLSSSLTEPRDIVIRKVDEEKGLDLE